MSTHTYTVCLWLSQLVLPIAQSMIAYSVLWPPYISSQPGCLLVVQTLGKVQACLAFVAAVTSFIVMYHYYERCAPHLRERNTQEIVVVSNLARVGVVIAVAACVGQDWPVACIEKRTREFWGHAALHATVILQSVPVMMMCCMVGCCGERQLPIPPPPPGPPPPSPRLSVVVEEEHTASTSEPVSPASSRPSTEVGIASYARRAGGEELEPLDMGSVANSNDNGRDLSCGSDSTVSSPSLPPPPTSAGEEQDPPRTRAGTVIMPPPPPPIPGSRARSRTVAA